MTLIELLKSDDDYDMPALADLLFEKIRFEDEEDNGYSLKDLSHKQLGALGDLILNNAGEYGYLLE